VTHYDDARSLLTDRRVSSNRTLPGYPFPTPGLAGFRKSYGPSSLQTTDEPEHGRQRRMLTHDFTAKRMRELRPAVQKLVDARIDAMVAAGPPIDLVQEFALTIPSLVICALLGVSYRDHDFFQERSMTCLSGVEAEAAKASSDLLQFLERLVEIKANEPGEDLISRVITQHVKSGELSYAQLVDHARVILLAGHETTGSQIALGCLALMRHPDQLKTFLQDLDDPARLANAVEELLRYLTIAQSGRARVALEDIEVGGTLIRAGDGILVSEILCNRDDAVFLEPNQLDIHRAEAQRHLAFGAGVHRCLGEPLAEMELQIAYSTLFRRLPNLRLAVPFEELKYKEQSATYGVKALPVSW
jgi:cytochrome P450